MDEPYPEEPSAIKKVDEEMTSTHSGSFDFMNNINRFLAGPDHNFHEVTSSLWPYFNFFLFGFSHSYFYSFPCQLIDSRFSELSTLVKNTYDFDLQNLCQRTQTQEAEVNSLQAELERIRARNQEVDSALSCQQNEAKVWKDKYESQTELIASQDTRIRALDLEVTKVKADLAHAKTQYLEINDKYNTL